MQLQPIDSRSLPLVADWLAEKENHQWLDFGSDVQAPPPVALRMMTQRDIHALRVFTAPDDERRPIGIVGLSNVTRVFKTASLWYVLGDKQYAGRGCTARAVAMLLDHGFGELGMVAINAWAVEQNRPSIRVLEKNGFRRIGCQRRCHWLGGRHVDRVLFDLLATEHREASCTATTTTKS